jgi:hypothetical protein
VSSPVPPAPPSYAEPEWRHDTIDALVIIDRSVGFEPADGRPLTHPIDLFVGQLEKHLQVGMNIAVHVTTTDEIRYEEDLPTQIYSVVTNDSSYADWCRSWGGTVVELEVDGDVLVVTARGQSQRFSPDELSRAVEFSADEVQHQSDDGGALDTGRSLLEPVSRKEIAGLESILAELWRAIDRDELNDIHRAQVLAMADLLKAQQLDATPGTTERWRVVGPVRAILKYLLKEVPKDALAWWKLIELLGKIHWSALAHELRL